MANSHRRAALGLLFAALLFSTGGAAIKAASFTGWQIASFRGAIAGLTLLLLVPAARRGWDWRPALVALAYAATSVCFVLATRFTTSANAIFIQATSPLYVMLLAPLLLREPVARRELVFLLPIALGLFLFLFGEQRPASTAPDPATGNLLATLSGLTFAFVVVGLRWLGRPSLQSQATPLTAATIGNFVTFLVALPLALPVGRHSTADWAILLYLGVVQIGLAYVFVTAALARLSALEASLLLLLEPVLNPVWSWLVHGEIPGRAGLVGGTLVLGATLVRALWPEPPDQAEKGMEKGRKPRVPT